MLQKSSHQIHLNQMLVKLHLKVGIVHYAFLICHPVHAVPFLFLKVLSFGTSLTFSLQKIKDDQWSSKTDIRKIQQKTSKDCQRFADRYLKTLKLLKLKIIIIMMLTEKTGYDLRTKLTFLYSHQNPKVRLNHLIWPPLSMKMKS